MERVTIVFADGQTEHWSAEKDGLHHVEVHPSGALLIYTEAVSGLVMLRAARSFGTWVGLEVDAPEPV